MVCIERVTDSSIDQALISLVSNTLPTGDPNQAYRYLQDTKVGNTNYERSLWQLILDGELVGWVHCGFHFNYANLVGDGVGAAAIEAEFNYIYIKPQYRNQKLSHQYGWKVGEALSKLVPFDFFKEEIASVEMGVPLELTTKAFCLNPRGKLAAISFAEGFHNGLSKESLSTLFVLYDEREDIFNDGFMDEFSNYNTDETQVLS